MKDHPPPEKPPNLGDLIGLDDALNVDIDAIVASVLRKRYQSPILPPVDLTLGDELPRDLPRQGTPLESVLDEVDRIVSSHVRRNAHPGFFGYVCSPGLPTDPLAHALVAALNQNVTGFPSAPGATVIERTLIRWLAGATGMPEGTEGLLLSGGSLANFTAVAAALHRAAGPEARRVGIGAAGGPFFLYVSEATHFSVERAAVLLGIGTEQVRKVPCDRSFRIRPDALAAEIERDARQGARPFCVVATAGTTTTGAIDPLEDIAKVCRGQETWLHVDAAYGGGALLSEALRPRFTGIEQADSVSLDLHKWFYLAFDGSALLIRDIEDARRVFYAQADYVQIPRQPAPDEFAFFHLGPETSRRFRALPAYLALRHYGADLLGSLALQNAWCAEYLAKMVRRHPDLELASEPQLSICCFRYAPAHLADRPERVDEANRAILARLLRDGDFYLSPTNLQGRPVLRVCILSHATRAEHMESLVRAVVRAGEGLAD